MTFTRSLQILMFAALGLAAIYSLYKCFITPHTDFLLWGAAYYVFSERSWEHYDKAFPKAEKVLPSAA